MGNQHLHLSATKIWFIFTLTAWTQPQSSCGLSELYHVKEWVFVRTNSLIIFFGFYVLVPLFPPILSMQYLARSLQIRLRTHGNVERTSRAQSVIREAIERIEVRVRAVRSRVERAIFFHIKRGTCRFEKDKRTRRMAWQHGREGYVEEGVRSKRCISTESFVPEIMYDKMIQVYLLGI